MAQPASLVATRWCVWQGDRSRPSGAPFTCYNGGGPLAGTQELRQEEAEGAVRLVHGRQALHLANRRVGSSRGLAATSHPLTRC